MKPLASLRPFLTLYGRHPLSMGLGILLAIITLLAAVALLSLSGWFLAAAALSGVSTRLASSAVTFNYLLPAVGVRLLSLLRTVGRYFERLISHDATLRLLADLRVYIFSRLIPLSPAGIAQLRHGELLSRLVADVDTLDHLYLRLVSPLLSAWVVSTTVTAILWQLNSYLSMALGTILLLQLLLIPPLFYWFGRKSGMALITWRTRYRLLLVEWLQGQTELLIFGAAARFRHCLDEIEHTWQQCQQRQAAVSGLAQGVMVLLAGATLLLMVWLAAGVLIDHQDAGASSTSSAVIALVAFGTLAVFEALAPVTTAFQRLPDIVACAERVQELLEQRPVAIFAHQGPPCPELLCLCLDRVSFTYPGRRQPALQDITLSLATDEKLALLGHTGCGKSTLLRLLTASWMPTRGEIRLNNHTLTDYSEAQLRQLMTVVSQRVHLFSATLADNLYLAAPTATVDQLAQVLQQVGLVHLLEQQGLATWIGDGGRPLSGGEQRRLGVARALLRDAPLLLLDEPTEGLDPQTEQQIFNLLLEHARGKAMILVTHRPHGLALLDRIAVMEVGCLVEQGTPAELLVSKGRYYQLQQRLQ